MGRVSGKVVVVTGAAGGQGLAEAAALAAEGATVVATDLYDEAETPDGVVYRRLDVSRPEDWSALAAWIESEHGRLDGLVNNAGIPFRARLDEIELADWDRVLGVNLTGTLLGIRTAAALMRGGGSIVNVSSIAGLTGYHAVAYTVSKWGVRGLSRVASMELGPRGIRVNAILPGYIDTPMTAPIPPMARAALLARTPLARVGDPREVALTALFLASDDGAFYTGQWLSPNGGLLMS